MSENFLNNIRKIKNLGKIKIVKNISNDGLKESNQVGNILDSFKIIKCKEETKSLQAIYQKNSYKEGFKIGEKKGFVAGLKKSSLEFEKNNNLIMNKMKKILSNFESALSSFDEKVSTQIINTVLKISKKILETTSINDNSILLKKINKIFKEQMFSLDNPKLIVNPNDQLFIKNHFGKIFDQYGWIICCDIHVPSGGFLVSSGDSMLNSTVSVRWNKLCKLVYSKEEQ